MGRSGDPTDQLEMIFGISPAFAAWKGMIKHPMAENWRSTRPSFKEHPTRFGDVPCNLRIERMEGWLALEAWEGCYEPMGSYQK